MQTDTRPLVRRSDLFPLEATLSVTAYSPEIKLRTRCHFHVRSFKQCDIGSRVMPRNPRVTCLSFAKFTICITALFAVPARLTALVHRAKYIESVSNVEPSHDFHILTDNDGCFGKHDPTSRDIPASRMNMEVVIAGHEFEPDFERSYLWDLKIWNLNFVLYRREGDDIAGRTWRGGCNMTAEERILIPNHGRDASAFYDYAKWRYENPPLAVVFLHGHAALGWHTSCETVLTRILAYWHSVTLPEAIPLPNAVISLTFARGRKETYFEPLSWNGGRRLQYMSEMHPEISSCQDVLAQINMTLGRASVTSCCGSFILPGAALRRHPENMYETLLAHVQDVSLDDQVTSRQCFEYIVFALFDRPHAPNSPFNELARKQLISWYQASKRLRSQIPSGLRSCEKNYGYFYLGDDNRLVLGKWWFPASRYVQG